MSTERLRIILPKLRPLQRDLYTHMRRWNVWVCHRRFGKTYLCLLILLKQAFECPLTAPRYAYLAPLYRQVKAIAWDYLKRLLAQIPGCHHNEAELWGELPTGARIQLLGADNPDSLRGVYLDGAVLDEYPHMRQRTFTEVIRPALSDRHGWAIKVGTPYGKNHFHAEYHAALGAMAEGDRTTHAALYKASQTGVLSAAELASARVSMGQDAYDQEYECEFEAAIPGAYYAEQFRQVDAERRITRVPYDPTYPVYTFWDIGIDDSTAIWCAQFIGRQICLIHYCEDSGYGLPYYATYLKNLPYEYRAHLFPHDGAHREWGSGERREDTAARLLPGRIEIAARPSLDTGIQNVRLMFPRLVFDAVGCEVGLNAARNYHHKYDADKKVFLNTPEHSWASHGADALRTLAVALPLVDQIEKEWMGVKVPPPEDDDELTYTLGGQMTSRGWLG
jgi:phage terminase large subunit